MKRWMILACILLALPLSCSAQELGSQFRYVSMNGALYALPPAFFMQSTPHNADQALVASWNTANTAGYSGALAVAVSSSALPPSNPTNANQVLTDVWNSTYNALNIYCVSGCGGGGGGGTVTNTGALTINRLIIGNNGVDVKALGSLGTTTTVLHGNAGGAPTFAAVNLAADVSGTLPLARGGTNQTSWTASRCVHVNSGGTALEVVSGDCNNGVSGSGTTGTIPLFTGSTVIGNSAATQDASYVVLTGRDLKLTNGSGDVTLQNVFGSGSISTAAGGYSFTNSGLTLTPNGAHDPYISLVGQTSGSAAIGVAAVAGTPNKINLPTATGSNGECLKTNGANPQQASWGACGSGGSVTPGAGSSGFTEGSVAFADSGGALNEDNANLFWDGANTQFKANSPNATQYWNQTIPAIFGNVTRSSATGDIYSGVEGNSIITDTAGGVGSIGIQGFASIKDVTNVTTTAIVEGMDAIASIDAASTANFTGVSTAPGLLGMGVHFSNSGSGTVSNATGILINSPSGDITNAYGLYVRDQTAATNNYAIKTGAGIVSFGDRLQLGTIHFAALGTVVPGQTFYCDDCDPSAVSGVANECTSAGAKTGALVVGYAAKWGCSSVN